MCGPDMKGERNVDWMNMEVEIWTNVTVAEKDIFYGQLTLSYSPNTTYRSRSKANVTIHMSVRIKEVIHN
jgi:hypothetical protein